MSGLDAQTGMELLGKIRLGDVEAFSRLFRQWYEPLCNYAGRFVHDLDAAENIVQDVFVRFWDNRNSLTIHTSVRSYLFTSVRNSCLNEIKHERFSLSLNGESEHPTPSSNQPDGQLESEELAEAIEAAMRRLPQKCREVFSLAKFDGLSYQEIAEVQNISVNTVKTQLKRALKSLSKSLRYLNLTILW